MAHNGTPHFHNDLGVSVVQIGAREFMCIGATPPFDHPHVFIDMGDDDEVVCSYCSTLYRYRADLPVGASEPAGARWTPPSAGIL
jgi:uncharacterized Zn-finger protein